jgi:5'-3' exoribonuclease 2
MNQQRSRRFRSTKENSEKQEEILSVRKDLESMGITLPPPKKHFNSNCITPGTPFMIRLSASLRQFVHMRIANDPAWQNIVVILSDASVPGEGEHKIMEFIRRQRASPIYNPNIVHCICGVDADLIMLGLASHEINLNILREDFSQQRPVKCEICDQIGHTFKSCDFSKNSNDTTQYRCKYIFVRLDILRNYLERDFRMLQLPYEFDLERAIDDWVFLCFFVGNDFLPHLPSLDIYEGAINRLICIYKQVSYQTNGYFYSIKL